MIGKTFSSAQARARAAEPAWFAFADEVASFCGHLTPRLQPNDLRQGLSKAMFERIAQSVEGGTLLVSVGMSEQASVIARWALEVFILLSAFAHTPASVDRYLRAHDARRSRLLKKLQKVEGREAIADDAWFARMRPFAAEKAVGAVDLNLSRFAEDGDVEATYDTVYAALSGPSHHLPVNVGRSMGLLPPAPDGEGGPAEILDGLTAVPILAMKPLGMVYRFDGEAAATDLIQRHVALRMS